MTEPTTTLAEFIDLKEHENGTWQAEIRDLQAVRDALGEDILIGLCRLLVGADRLESTIRLLFDVATGGRQDLPASASDRITLFLFASGTMREMAKAVDRLSGAGLKDRLTELGKRRWGKLRRSLNHWNHDDNVCYIRDRMAFHIDEELIRDGLAALCAEGKPVGFASGHGKAYKDGRTELGTSVLLAGSKFDLKAFEDLAKRIAPDQLQFPTMIYDVVKEIRVSSPNS